MSAHDSISWQVGDAATDRGSEWFHCDECGLVIEAIPQLVDPGWICDRCGDAELTKVAAAVGPDEIVQRPGYEHIDIPDRELAPSIDSLEKAEGAIRRALSDELDLPADEIVVGTQMDDHGTVNTLVVGWEDD